MKIKYDGIFHVTAEMPEIMFHMQTNNVNDLKKAFISNISEAFDEAACNYELNSHKYSTYASIKEKQAARNEGRKGGNENSLISAKEAKQWADRYASKELDRIYRMISDAALEGKYSVYEEGNLQESTKQELEKLGYKVKTGDQFNDLYFVVSWG